MVKYTTSTSIMGIFLKGNWCCFQVLGDLDPFLVKFFEVERGRPRFRLAIKIPEISGIHLDFPLIYQKSSVCRRDRATF